MIEKLPFLQGQLGIPFDVIFQRIGDLDRGLIIEIDINPAQLLNQSLQELSLLFRLKIFAFFFHIIGPN